MFTSIAEYFKDEEDANPSFIQLTRNILTFVIVTNLALVPLVTGLIGEDSQNFIALTVLIFTLALEIIALAFVQQGRVQMAKAVVPLALIVAATIIAFGVNGLKNTGMVALPVILVISAILLGKRVFVLITPLMVVSVILVAIADLNGRIPFVPAGLDDAIIIIFLLISGAGIINLLIRRLNESIQLARTSEEIQKRENRELNELRSALEERVRQRTAELELANSANERRAHQFEAITQVLTTISTIQGIEALLPRIAGVISEQFGVYHAGIFMQDSNREFAVLRAANSDGGRKMLARNHKLRIGQTGIVGFVAATGQPRIAIDVGADAAYFDNPDLPDTRSEIALPLRYAGKIIGVLDVQSTEPNAFNQDDIDVLVTLADQVAIAINNALTIEEAQRSLAEVRSAISQTTQEAWNVLRPKSLGVGFQLTETAVKPLEKPIEGEHIQHALKTGEPIQFTDENQQSRLAIPVQLRGRTIGVIHLGARNHAPLTDDDADIAKAVAERLSLAIETATLLQATQRRADIERITADISSRISSSTRFETILQTAAQELSRALGGSDVLVQIEPVSMKMVMDT
jgi:GAF domain-containing protein